MRLFYVIRLNNDPMDCYAATTLRLAIDHAFLESEPQSMIWRRVTANDAGEARVKTFSMPSHAKGWHTHAAGSGAK